MKIFKILLISALTLTFPCFLSAYEKPVTLDLSGEWQMFLDKDGADSVEVILKTEQGWKNIRVPHNWIDELNEKETKFIWFKKEFTLDEKTAGLNSVLRWKQIYFGATAYINGKEAGKTELIAPYWNKLDKGLLVAGKNTICIKVNGWPSLKKNSGGYALIPTGSASFDWGDRKAKISDRIWLDFYDDIYIINTMLLPDIKEESLGLKVWTLREPPAGKVYFDLIIRDKKDTKIVDTTVEAEGENPVSFKVKLDHPILWEIEDPYLYTAELTARVKGTPHLFVSRFGMREFAVKDGRFSLNGKMVILKGSELVTDWRKDYLKSKDSIIEYAVTTPRQYNFNCFRTHTMPPPDNWLDIFDENGFLILAEFPVTYNWIDFKFNPEELKIFADNSTQDALARMQDLANHPSVIIWVPSNENLEVNSGWEVTSLIKLMKELDPTRPILRAFALTDDCRDIHDYNGFWGGTEGTFYSDMRKFTGERGKYKEKAHLNTEYIEAYNPRRQQRWAGKPSEGQKDEIIYAEFCAEQTEILRRLDFDAMTPYWYAYWNNPKTNFQWRKDFLSPALAALKNSFAPVLASIDIFNRNFVAGSELKTDIHYINDTGKTLDTEFDFYITENNPEYVPYSDVFFKPVYSATVLKTLKPYEHLIQAFEWKVPTVEGIYYLSVVAHPKGEGPAVSQREIHAINRSNNPPASKKITLCGFSSAVEEFLNVNKVPLTKEFYENIETDLLIACSMRELQNEFAVKNKIFEDFFERGGKAVILEDDSTIDIKIPVELKTLPADLSSRAFISPSENESSLVKNILPAYLWRFNEYDGVCYKNPIITTGLNKNSYQSVLYGSKPEWSPLIILKYKKGEIIISRLEIKKRLNAGTKSYDPVAERMFLNFLNY